MKRFHRMPFGAEVRSGGVLFRLWAPTERHLPEEGSLPPWSVAWFLDPAT